MLSGPRRVTHPTPHEHADSHNNAVHRTRVSRLVRSQRLVKTLGDVKMSEHSAGPNRVAQAHSRRKWKHPTVMIIVVAIVLDAEGAHRNRVTPTMLVFEEIGGLDAENAIESQKSFNFRQRIGAVPLRR
jgi:hypothetical protein